MLPLMDPAFNLREVVKNLILLEDHLLHEDRRCPDCIKKHLLAAEAFADESASLSEMGENPVPSGTSTSLRNVWDRLGGGACPIEIGQEIRQLRKALVARM